MQNISSLESELKDNMNCLFIERDLKCGFIHYYVPITWYVSYSNLTSRLHSNVINKKCKEAVFLALHIHKDKQVDSVPGAPIKMDK